MTIVCVHRPTYGVAALHLIDRCLWRGEPRVPSAAAELDKHPLVGWAVEVALSQVTAVCSQWHLLILTHTRSLCFTSQSLRKSRLRGEATVQQQVNSFLLLTSSIPATSSVTPVMCPIQHTTPYSGGSFTSTMEPTSSSPSGPASPPFSSAGYSRPPWAPSPWCSCCVSTGSGDVGLSGLGGGRGGTGTGFWRGFGGGSGGGLSCGGLVGGIRATLGPEDGGDVDFRMDLGAW